MHKYEEVKKLIDINSKKCADDFDNLEEYNLMIRIGQMYRELEQVKLSYEKLLNTEIGEIIKIIVQARQTLYNTRDPNSRKRDLIDGIDYAIEDLNKILVLKEVNYENIKK